MPIQIVAFNEPKHGDVIRPLIATVRRLDTPHDEPPVSTTRLHAGQSADFNINSRLSLEFHVEGGSFTEAESTGFIPSPPPSHAFPKDGAGPDAAVPVTEAAAPLSHSGAILDASAKVRETGDALVSARKRFEAANDARNSAVTDRLAAAAAHQSALAALNKLADDASDFGN